MIEADFCVFRHFTFSPQAFNTKYGLLGKALASHESGDGKIIALLSLQ